MNIKKVLLTIGLLLFGAFFIYAQEPGIIAPVADLSQNAPPLVKENYEEWSAQIPTTEEVNLPSYPGSFIISEKHYSYNDQTYGRLPTITLVTNDPESQVIDFYMKAVINRTGWNWNKDYKMFLKGDFNRALKQEVPFILIEKVLPDEEDLHYISSDIRELARTKITICYNPDRISNNNY